MPLLSFICANQIELGNDVDIRPFVFISVERLVIGSSTIVSFGCQIKGDKGFQAGDNCILGAHAIVHCDENVTLGFYCGVGPRSTIYTHGSFLPVTRGYPALFAEVILEDFVWSAMGVMFLPGAHVQTNCIINPGVVVSGRVEANSRLQLSEQAFQRLDQSKLLRFSRRRPEYYHEKIVRGFLHSEGLKSEITEGGRKFVATNGISFHSDPENNSIEFFRGERPTASYDFEGFWTSESRDPVHRRFLTYVRKHFGVILRTKYR